MVGGISFEMASGFRQFSRKSVTNPSFSIVYHQTESCTHRTDEAEIESSTASTARPCSFRLGHHRRAQPRSGCAPSFFLKLIEDGNLDTSRQKSLPFAGVRNAVLNEAKIRNRHTPLDADSVRLTQPGLPTRRLCRRT